MKLIFVPYKYGSWRTLVCLIMICYDSNNFSFLCKGYRLEENSMNLMFDHFATTQLTEYK